MCVMLASCICDKGAYRCIKKKRMANTPVLKVILAYRIRSVRRRSRLVAALD